MNKNYILTQYIDTNYKIIYVENHWYLQYRENCGDTIENLIKQRNSLLSVCSKDFTISMHFNIYIDYKNALNLLNNFNKKIRDNKIDNLIS